MKCFATPYFPDNKISMLTLIGIEMVKSESVNKNRLKSLFELNKKKLINCNVKT